MAGLHIAGGWVGRWQWSISAASSAECMDRRAPRRRIGRRWRPTGQQIGDKGGDRVRGPRCAAAGNGSPDRPVEPETGLGDVIEMTAAARADAVAMVVKSRPGHPTTGMLDAGPDGTGFVGDTARPALMQGRVGTATGVSRPDSDAERLRALLLDLAGNGVRACEAVDALAQTPPVVCGLPVEILPRARRRHRRSRRPPRARTVASSMVYLLVKMLHLELMRAASNPAMGSGAEDQSHIRCLDAEGSSSGHGQGRARPSHRRTSVSVGFRPRPLPACTVSKDALLGLTRSLAVDRSPLARTF